MPQMKTPKLGNFYFRAVSQKKALKQVIHLTLYDQFMSQRSLVCLQAEQIEALR